MGILDEAIKEHLDLKRRRGADPTEVERLEREALGPVRRAPQEAADGILDHETAAGVAYPDEEPGHEWAEPLGEESLAEEPLHEEALHEEALPEEPLLEREREAPRHHEIAEEWHAHESLAAEQTGAAESVHEPLAAEQHPLNDEGPGLESDAPAPAVPPPAPASPPPSESRPLAPPPDEADHLAEETAEYDVEAEHRGERPRPREDEDVLEETPEFLQDTPDHDRLWFEQRPPKDFDFDK